jgi:hypothetical protein
VSKTTFFDVCITPNLVFSYCSLVYYFKCKVSQQGAYDRDAYETSDCAKSCQLISRWLACIRTQVIIGGDRIDRLNPKRRTANRHIAVSMPGATIPITAWYFHPAVPPRVLVLFGLVLVYLGGSMVLPTCSVTLRRCALHR